MHVYNHHRMVSEMERGRGRGLGGSIRRVRRILMVWGKNSLVDLLHGYSGASYQERKEVVGGVSRCVSGLSDTSVSVYVGICKGERHL